MVDITKKVYTKQGNSEIILLKKLDGSYWICFFIDEDGKSVDAVYDISTGKCVRAGSRLEALERYSMVNAYKEVTKYLNVYETITSSEDFMVDGFFFDSKEEAEASISKNLKLVAAGVPFTFKAYT